MSEMLGDPEKCINILNFPPSPPKSFRHPIVLLADPKKL